MLKNVFVCLLQCVLFLVVSFLGITLPALHMVPSHITIFANGTRGFEWDGVFLALALLVLILIIEAAMKRLRTAAPWTMIALLLAALVEFALKVGVRDL